MNDNLIPSASAANRPPIGADTVLVAMSGGVDSSVAAWLLTTRGYDCVGVTMKLYDSEPEAPTQPGAKPPLCRNNSCCSLAVR